MSHIVTLNLLQGPPTSFAAVRTWMLKQVQHDDLGARIHHIRPLTQFILSDAAGVVEGLGTNGIFVGVTG